MVCILDVTPKIELVQLNSNSWTRTAPCKTAAEALNIQVEWRLYL